MSSHNVDRLSRLPAEIRSHVLSLMPTLFAVRTSILSKTWRYSWTMVTNLDFDDAHCVKSLTKFVDRVLKFRSTSQINLFRLHVCNNWAVKSSHVSKWINKAVKLNVHELDIDVISFEFPLSLFTCKTLTNLRLDHWATELSDWPVNLPCLKSLDISVYNPYANAFKLIHGCPVLECLTLTVSWHNPDEVYYIFNIPTLKRLKLTWLEVELGLSEQLEAPNSPDVRSENKTNRVVLNVPNLEYLFVVGVLCFDFVMEDVSSLVEASLSFSEKSFTHLWVELLNGISGVKSLSVQTLSSFIDSRMPFNSRMPVFPNMKQLELKGFWHSGLILRFLENSPELKHLCIEKGEENSWTEPKLVPACMLTNFTTVKFSKCKGQKWDLHLLEYMLRNAKVLKMVTIILENFCAEEEMRLCARLRWLKGPRASRYCKIRFLEN